MRKNLDDYVLWKNYVIKNTTIKKYDNVVNMLGYINDKMVINDMIFRNKSKDVDCMVGFLLDKGLNIEIICDVQGIRCKVSNYSYRINKIGKTLSSSIRYAVLDYLKESKIHADNNRL